MTLDDRLNWSDNEFNKISESLADKDHLDIYDFLRIRNFKISNSSRASEEEVELVTREAFELAKKHHARKAIALLTTLHGVRIPIASAILAEKFPKSYCIIDRIVIGELGKTEWLEDYETNPNTYLKYLVEMKLEARANGMALRDYECSLFERGKRKRLSPSESS